MKVILNIDLKGSGKKGDIIEVNDGYAKNFLLPYNKAIIANDINLIKLKQYNDSLKHKFEKNKKTALEIQKKIESKILYFNLIQGINNKIFGQITNKEISEKLKLEYSIIIDKHKILIDKSINSIGQHNVKIKLYNNIIANLNIIITIDKK